MQNIDWPFVFKKIIKSEAKYAIISWYVYFLGIFSPVIWQIIQWSALKNSQISAGCRQLNFFEGRALSKKRQIAAPVSPSPKCFWGKEYVSTNGKFWSVCRHSGLVKLPLTPGIFSFHLPPEYWQHSKSLPLGSEGISKAFLLLLLCVFCVLVQKEWLKLFHLQEEMERLKKGIGIMQGCTWL